MLFVFAFVGVIVMLLANIYYDMAKYRFGILQANESWRRRAYTAATMVYDTGVISINSFFSVLSQEPAPTDSPLVPVRLRLEPGAIEEMVSNLPTSAKAKFFKGEMLYPDGSWQNIRFRLRGRNIWHWHPDKPSLRIVLRRSAPLDLQRHLNLVNPEDRTMLANPYGEELGRRMGVLAPRTWMARLFINGESRGVYQLTTREDENMLRLAKRIPGPFFVGDRLRRQWAADQFEIAGEDSILTRRNPIVEMVDAVNMAPTPARYDALWSILDMEKTARWQALLSLSGGIHTDFHHNHLYYFDPTAGRLEPVVTDVLGLGTLLYPRPWERLSKKYVPATDLPLNEKLQPLFDAALRDPRYHHLRNQVLFGALNGPASTEAQQDLLLSMVEEIEGDVAADRFKAGVMETFGGFFRVPYSNWQFDDSIQLALAWIAERNQFLVDELNNTEVRVAMAAADDGSDFVLVEVNGNSAVEFDTARLGGEVAADLTLSGRSFVPVDGTRLLQPGLKEDLDFSYELTIDRRSPLHHLRPDWQRYLFRVAGRGNIRDGLAGAFRNAVTGIDIDPEIRAVASLDPGSIEYNTVSLHPWQLPAAPTRDVVLGPGAVDLDETVYVAASQRLIVRPGTELKLGPEVSLISEGPVHIEGSPEARVSISRLVADRPWGVLAIQGRNAAGSSISHADISGGSVATALNIDYSGMVSAHWAGEISISNTTISGNVIGDDTLHVVHSDVDIDDLTLANCFGDCVDFDYATGTVSGVQTNKSGNDALDFMTSDMTILNGRIDSAGDKGISAGEDSTLSLEDVVITGSQIGIAVKDKSEVSVRSGALTKNFVAVDVYAKNERYGGPGSIEFSELTFRDNEVDLRTEEGGSATFNGQAIPSKVAGEGTVTRAN